MAFSLLLLSPLAILLPSAIFPPPPRPSQADKTADKSTIASAPASAGGLAPARTGLTGPAGTGDHGAAAPAMMWPAHRPDTLPTLTTPSRIANNAAAGGGRAPTPTPTPTPTPGDGGEVVEGLPDSLPLTGLTFEGVFAPTQVRMTRGRKPVVCLVFGIRYPESLYFNRMLFMPRRNVWR